MDQTLSATRRFPNGPCTPPVGAAASRPASNKYLRSLSSKGPVFISGKISEGPVFARASLSRRAVLSGACSALIAAVFPPVAAPVSAARFEPIVWTVGPVSLLLVFGENGMDTLDIEGPVSAAPFRPRRGCGCLMCLAETPGGLR